MSLLFKVFKLCLFGLNTFYFVFGILLLIGTAFFYLNPNQINDFIKVEYGLDYMHLISFMAIFSLFLNLVGLVGCTGILNEKSWILFVYFCLLFFIFGCQFTGAIYLYVQSVNYFNDFKHKIQNAIKHEYGKSAVHSRTLDYMHYSFKCCGWESPRDWLDSDYIDPKYAFRTSNTNQSDVITISPVSLYKIPHSCCMHNYDLTCVLMHKFHEIGCESILKAYYNQIEMYVAWTLAFFNIFQLFLLVLALYLICMIFFRSQTSWSSDSSSTSVAYARRAERHDSDNESVSSTASNQDDDKLFMTSFYL